MKPDPLFDQADRAAREAEALRTVNARLRGQADRLHETMRVLLYALHAAKNERAIRNGAPRPQAVQDGPLAFRAARRPVRARQTT